MRQEPQKAMAAQAQNVQTYEHILPIDEEFVLLIPETIIQIFQRSCTNLSSS